MGAGARRAVLVLALTLGAAPGLGSAPAPAAARERPTGPAAVPAAGEPDLATLRQLFQSPPDDSRILMRWWWFGSAVTKAGIEREMRLMKEGGIGGFEVQAVYPVALDDPGRGLRNLPFLSDEFIEALRFTADQAREMGLRIDLTVGSGWPYGGPRVPITQAAGKLRVERSRPAAGSRRVPLPDVGAGEELIAAFLGRLEGGSIAPASLRELSDVRNGAAWLPAGLEGPHEALFFVASRTGMMVKRPAVGAEGFVVDHYDRAALDHYLAEVGDRLMQAFGPRPPYAVFCDSLEVFDSDWTADFLDEFRRRRGYDLRPHLPALVADVGPGTPGLRHDWGRTLTELLDERFLAPMREWARRHGTRFRVQGYGIPPATIASNAHADLPEGEGYQWKALRASRWASSASHLYG
ncbi:MAG TPA: glycosyl hydrolase, partial [Vicinamibacteria bacterium]|nr:glycosyl hydrolase [Vicinamibacteria bacterium]